MYTWEPYNDLWGIQYYNGTQGAMAMETMQEWIVGTRFRRCVTNNKETKVRCNFTGAEGLFQIVYPTKGTKSFKTNKRFTEVCNLTGSCQPIKNRKVRVSGPVLLKR
jgi:hypothetical protein